MKKPPRSGNRSKKSPISNGPTKTSRPEGLPVVDWQGKPRNPDFSAYMYVHEGTVSAGVTVQTRIKFFTRAMKWGLGAGLPPGASYGGSPSTSSKILAGL